MIKKLILTLLSFAIFSYSTAWAFSGLDTNAVDGLIDNLQISEQMTHAELKADTADHCDHLSSHLLVIFNEFKHVVSVTTHSDSFVFTEEHISYITPIHTKPPRA